MKNLLLFITLIVAFSCSEQNSALTDDTSLAQFIKQRKNELTYGDNKEKLKDAKIYLIMRGTIDGSWNIDGESELYEGALFLITDGEVTIDNTGNSGYAFELSNASYDIQVSIIGSADNEPLSEGNYLVPKSMHDYILNENNKYERRIRVPYVDMRMRLHKSYSCLEQDICSYFPEIYPFNPTEDSSINLVLEGGLEGGDQLTFIFDDVPYTVYEQSWNENVFPMGSLYVSGTVNSSLYDELTNLGIGVNGRSRSNELLRKIMQPIKPRHLTNPE